jgi:hypothetical protein
VKGLFALLMLVAPAAHADLYRWVDPQTGSVKFSSVPPPASQTGVEVVPYRGAASATAKPPPAASGAAERRWRALLAELSQAQPGSPAVQQRLPELAAAGAELDRLDPGGADRRHAEAQRVLLRVLTVGK